MQETGAANFFLIRDGELLTRSLDSTFLHGVTRDSLLTLGRDMGYSVSERKFDVLEMLDWVHTGEAALSGTAAVLAGVGTSDLCRHRASGGHTARWAADTRTARAIGRGSAG